MLEAKLDRLEKSIRDLRTHHTSDLSHVLQIDNRIEYEKEKRLECSIGQKKKLLRKIQAKIRRLKKARLRYMKKIRSFRQKLYEKLQQKQKIQARIEDIQYAKIKRTEQYRKRRMLKRLVMHARLQRLKHMAKLKPVHKRIYQKELSEIRRKKRLAKKYPKKISPILKKMKKKIRKHTHKKKALQKSIIGIRTSLESYNVKANVIKSKKKTLRDQEKEIKKELGRRSHSKSKGGTSSSMSLKGSRSSSSKRSEKSIKSKSKASKDSIKSARSSKQKFTRDSATSRGSRKSSTKSPHTKHRKSSSLISSGTQEPKPIGDTGPQSGRRRSSRRSRKSSVRIRKSSSAKRSSKNELTQQGAGDTLEQKVKKEKNIFAPIDKKTLKYIYLPEREGPTLKMPRYSSSKPTYSGKPAYNTKLSKYSSVRPVNARASRFSTFKPRSDLISRYADTLQEETEEIHRYSDDSEVDYAYNEAIVSDKQGTRLSQLRPSLLDKLRPPLFAQRRKSDGNNEGKLGEEKTKNILQQKELKDKEGRRKSQRKQRGSLRSKRRSRNKDLLPVALKKPDITANTLPLDKTTVERRRSTKLHQPPKEEDIYDEKYYKELVRRKTKLIREELTRERKLKIAQKQKEAAELEIKRLEQQEANKKKQVLHPDLLLERLVEEGLRSNFNFFEVIPNQVSIIDEEILKMSDRGARINIMDLVPTSSKLKTTDASLAKRRKSKRKPKMSTMQRRRSTMEELETIYSDEEDEVLEKTSILNYISEGTQSEQLEEEDDAAIKQKRREERHKAKLEQCRQKPPKPEEPKPKATVVCEACGMTNMDPLCCKLPKKEEPI